MKRMRFHLAFLVLVFLFLISFIRAEIPPELTEKISNGEEFSPVKIKYTLYNANKIGGWICWDGTSGINPLTGNAGIRYPRGTGNVVFQDGLIWGGYIHDGSYPTLRVGGQTYNTGTVSGRIISPGNAQSPQDPDVRIYRIRRDYRTVSASVLLQDAAEFFGIELSTVSVAHIDSIRANYARDWEEWPVEYGAPFYDDNMNGMYEPHLGEEPGLQGADQVIWFVCNDLDPARVAFLYGSNPIGLELQVTISAYDVEGALGETVFRRYRLINKSGFSIDSMFVSQWSDCDLGDFSNDLCGCDSVLNMGYVYNGTASDEKFDPFGIAPPAFAYVLLQGPRYPSPGDTALFNFKPVPDYANRPMTSFWYGAVGNSEWRDPVLQEYTGTLQWYNALNVFLPIPDSMKQVPFTHRNTGQITKFPLNGDPVTGTGDIDGQGANFWTGARRFAFCSGPFDMAPGDTQEVIIATVGGLGDNRLRSVEQMQNHVRDVRRKFKTGKLISPQTSLSIVQPSNTETKINSRIDLQDFLPASRCRLTFYPSEGNEPSFNVELYDDGQHQDSLAGDGIWGNSTTVNNRKYPYQADVFVTTMSGVDTIPAIEKYLTLRPTPELTDWQVIWENGRQDRGINYHEKVYLGFSVKNTDMLNSISSIFFSNENYGGSSHQIISPGSKVGNDSLFLILYGPESGDFLTFYIFLAFDSHTIIQSYVHPLIKWASPSIWRDTLQVQSVTGTAENIFPVVADPSLLNRHIYQLHFYENSESGELLWRLFDVTTGTDKYVDGVPSNELHYPHPVIDGIEFIVKGLQKDFKQFLVTANAAGPIVPPDIGCFAFNRNGFPLLYNERYSDGTDHPTPGVQQVNSNAVWGFHTGMTFFNDGTYSYFKERVVRNDNSDRIIPYDFEMRFNSTGSLAAWVFDSDLFAHVPFEIWNIGINTPEDPGDDFKMIPWIFNDIGNAQSGDTLYNINPADHIVSDGEDDPYMDWVYWMNPQNTEPGTAGYDQYVTDARSGAYDYDSPEVLARTVLVNWDGGNVYSIDFPANLNAVMPEEGTVFRIITTKPNYAGDILLIESTGPVFFDGLTYELYPNFPNPFNMITTIPYRLSAGGLVKLEIYNILGQKVRTLVDRYADPGGQRVEWHGRNDDGVPVASGIYIIRLTAGDFVKSRKLVLLR